MWCSSCPLRRSYPGGRSRLLDIIPVPCDECHVCLGMETQNLWGRNSRGGGEKGMFSLAKAKPEETCRFNNRDVPGWQNKRLEG